MAGPTPPAVEALARMLSMPPHPGPAATVTSEGDSGDDPPAPAPAALAHVGSPSARSSAVGDRLLRRAGSLLLADHARALTHDLGLGGHTHRPPSADGTAPLSHTGSFGGGHGPFGDGSPQPPASPALRPAPRRLSITLPFLLPTSREDDDDSAPLPALANVLTRRVSRTNSHSHMGLSPGPGGHHQPRSLVSSGDVTGPSSVSLAIAAVDAPQCPLRRNGDVGAGRAGKAEEEEPEWETVVVPPTPHQLWAARWRSVAHAAWQLLERPEQSRAGVALFCVLTLNLVLSITVFVLETMLFASDEAVYSQLHAIEAVNSAVFTAEFVARAVSCPRPSKFWRSWLNWVDLVALIPFYIELAVSSNLKGALAIHVLRLFRLIRLVKNARSLASVQIFVRAVVRSAHAIAALIFFLAVGIIFFGSIIYFFEVGTSPGFASIPLSFWWAAQTLTLIGYGDVVPETTGGRYFSALAMVCALLVISLPVSVIGANFKEVLRERVVTLERHQREIAAESALQSDPDHLAAEALADRALDPNADLETVMEAAAAAAHAASSAAQAASAADRDATAPEEQHDALMALVRATAAETKAEMVLITAQSAVTLRELEALRSDVAWLAAGLTKLLRAGGYTEPGESPDKEKGIRPPRTLAVGDSSLRVAQSLMGHREWLPQARMTATGDASAGALDDGTNAPVRGAAPVLGSARRQPTPLVPGESAAPGGPTV